MPTIVGLACLGYACGGPPETIREKCVAALEPLEDCGILEDRAGDGFDDGCEQLEREAGCDQEISALWSCLDSEEPCCSEVPGECCTDELIAFIQCSNAS
jgi:hypothetical protein